MILGFWALSLTSVLCIEHFVCVVQPKDLASLVHLLAYSMGQVTINTVSLKILLTP
jgi:hypothetical protein